jgi:hypothetical protein
MGYLLLWAGCILPVSTGAPLPATTVGQGHIGVALSGEAPTLNLIADEAVSEDNFDDFHGAAPAAAATLTLSYGIAEDTDLELAGEGALYFFILPLPTGGSVGVRQHLLANDLLDLAIAGRFGGVSAGASTTSSDGSSSGETSASAIYGAVQLAAQTREGVVRPMAGLNFMPFRIRRHPSEEPEYRFKGIASSLTLGIMLVGRSAQFGPYFTVTNFESDRYAGGWFWSGGLMLAIRPDRNRRRPLPPPPLYAPPPPAPFAPPPGEPPPPPPAPSGPPGGP